MMKKLVIFGTKNFAEMAHYMFVKDSQYDVSAFTVDSSYMTDDSFKGLPIIPYEELRNHFSPDEIDIFVAIGIEKINELRASKVDEVISHGYSLASFVSSKAYVTNDLYIQPNTMVMDRAEILPGTTIGYNTIIWPHTRIAMKVNIGAHCWLTSAILGEQVTVGDYTFIGLNSTIAPSVSIGKSNLIGAGSLILKSSKDFAVYKGHESKPTRIKSTRIKNMSIIH